MGYNFIASAPAPPSNRNVTARLNYDQTLRPTMLLHVGIGYIWQRQPTDTPAFDQSALGLQGYPVSDRFPSMTVRNAFSPNINELLTGGYGPGVGPPFIATIYEQKPTGNINLTWVKGNHTYKFGGELSLRAIRSTASGAPMGSSISRRRRPADPWQNFQPLNTANPTGFTYASFMLGLVDRCRAVPIRKPGSAATSWGCTRRIPGRSLAGSRWTTACAGITRPI